MKLGLFAKVALPILAVLVLGLAAMTSIIVTRTTAISTDLALEAGEATAEENARRIEALLNPGFAAAESITELASAMAASGQQNRETVNAFLIELVRSNDRIVGAWVGFDANAFDGRDSEFADAPATIMGGRYVPFAFERPGGTVELIAMASLEPGHPEHGELDWFTRSYQTGRPVLTEPYYDNEAKILMTSLTVPVKIGGRIVGTAGVDMSLNFVNTLLAGLSTEEMRSIALITNGGLWGATGNSEEGLGEPVVQFVPSIETALADIKAGRPGRIEEYSDFYKADIIRIIRPTRPGGINEPWAIMVDLDRDRALADVSAMGWTITAIAFGVVVLLVGAVAILLRLMAIQPIRTLTGAMDRISGGRTSDPAPMIERTDEIGGMAKAVDFFRQKLIEIDQLQSEAREQERRATEQAQQERIRLADEFERAVSSVIAKVTAAAGELETNARTLMNMANQSSEEAESVANLSESVSTNVSTVAAATEQLSSSITEISSQVMESARIATDAAGEIEETNGTMEELAQAAESIGSVVSLIQDIAEQTNLLALNATIEAARAGDAGKGFAVVATEVKALATQTQQATTNITDRIQQIRTISNNAVEASGRIQTTISNVQQISTTISSAVEEQTAATQEISGNVQRTSADVDQFRTSTGLVRDAANSAKGASSEVLTASGMLSQEAASLSQTVSTFIRSVRG